MKLDFNLVDFVGYMCGAIPAWRVNDKNSDAETKNIRYDEDEETDECAD